MYAQPRYCHAGVEGYQLKYVRVTAARCEGAVFKRRSRTGAVCQRTAYRADKARYSQAVGSRVKWRARRKVVFTFRYTKCRCQRHLALKNSSGA